MSKFFAIGPGFKDHVFSVNVKLPCVFLNQSCSTHKKIPHCTLKFCDLCEQVFEIGPGFKVHTAFHEISVNEKLSFAILNQSSCTQQFTHIYSKTVCKLCEQVFAIGSGFKDHTAFYKFSGVNANPSYVMSSTLFHKKS